MDATLTVDTSLLSQLDRRFFGVLLATMMVHALAATWVARQPYQASSDAYDAPMDRFSRAPLLPMPKVFPTVKVAAPSAGGPPAPRPSRPASGPVGRRPAALSGLLAGAVGALTRSDGIDEALAGAQAGQVDTTTLATRRVRGPGAAQGIGPIVTSVTHGAIGVGEHVDAPVVPGRVEDPIVETDAPAPEAYSRYIAQRKSGLVACYERELKYHRQLRGRVTVQLLVAPDGRARAVVVRDEGLGSAGVAACIETLVKRWTFPMRPEEPQPLQFPVLFSPAR